LPWVLCSILLVLTTAFGYRAYRVAPAAGTAASDQGPPSSAPTAPTAVAASGDVVLPAKGYCIPAHQVQLSPKVGGMMVKLNKRFQEGEFFKEGEELAWIEDVDFKSDVDHAIAALHAAEQRRDELKCYRKQEVEQAERELQESQANLVQLDLDLRRTLKLIPTGSATQKDYEAAQYTRDAVARRVDRLKSNVEMMREGPRKEKLLAAEEDVRSAQADLDKAKWRLENCIIRAPIDGHILKKNAEKGNVVNPLAFNVATSLCDMANLADLEIDISVQERDIKVVFDKQECTVMPEAYENHEPFRNKHPRGYRGVVSRQMPVADRSKGAIQVRVKVEVPADEVGKYLKPDMSVLVYFLKGTADTSER
jgi:multidrug resistance efflux pump